jgi:hypothetical protein
MAGRVGIRGAVNLAGSTSTPPNSAAPGRLSLGAGVHPDVQGLWLVLALEVALLLYLRKTFRSARGG